MTYIGRQKQLLDNKQLRTVGCERLGTSLYIAVLHQRGCFIQRHIPMIQCNHMILLWCWNIINSNFELQLLGRSELTVQCTNAFNRIPPIPRSTKQSPFFSLHLQFLCFLYRTFQRCNVIIWWKQKDCKVANIQTTTQKIVSVMMHVALWVKTRRRT